MIEDAGDRRERLAKCPQATLFPHLRQDIMYTPHLGPISADYNTRNTGSTFCRHSTLLRTAPVLSFPRHRHSAPRCAGALFCSFSTVSFKMHQPPIAMNRRSPLHGARPSSALCQQSPM